MAAMPSFILYEIALKVYIRIICSAQQIINRYVEIVSNHNQSRVSGFSFAVLIPTDTILV